MMKPTLSPPQRLPLGIPITIVIIEKNRKRAGNEGKREKAGAFFSLSPSHRAQRALFFSLPSLPTTQRGRGERTIGTGNKIYKPTSPTFRDSPRWAHFFINNNFKEFRQALSRNDYCKQKPVSKVPSDTKILENPLLKVTCDSSTSEAYKLYPLLVEAKDAEELFVSLNAFKFYS